MKPFSFSVRYDDDAWMMSWHWDYGNLSSYSFHKEFANQIARWAQDNGILCEIGSYWAAFHTQEDATLCYLRFS